MTRNKTALQGATVEADVVIIGSGIAGALSAYTLAKAGLKVIILEAGPRIERSHIVQKFTETHKFDYSSGFPNEDWAPRPDWEPGEDLYFEHTGNTEARIEYLRAVGGTTWHWSGGAARLMPVDMKLRSTYGAGNDWPIDYKDLEPFYTLAEKEMGVSGDMAQPPKIAPPRKEDFPLPPIPHSYADKIIAKGLDKIGISYSKPSVARNSRPYDNRSQCMGFGTCSPICPSGAQYSAMVHIEKAEKLGVRVLDNTRVDRLIPNDKNNIGTVFATRSDGTTLSARAKVFILAANGIESPRLLLMSANEIHPKGLTNSSGQLGRNFFEHPGIVARVLMPKPVYPRGPEDTMGSPDFRDGPFRRTRAGWLLGFHNRAFIHEVADKTLQEGLHPPQLDRAIRDTALRLITINTQMEQLPNFKNGMTLDWTRRDRAGQPFMQIRYDLSDYERASFDDARLVFKRIADALDAKVISVSAPLVHHHPMGMTMMGADAKTSVVDATCRSHDHANLYIVGASVFPAGGIDSPTLTIAALALRTATHIADTWHTQAH